MGKLIEFEIGCRRCKHLKEDPLEEGLFMCTAIEYDSGMPLYPIADNNRTEDWNGCNGEDREWAGPKYFKNVSDNAKVIVKNVRDNNRRKI